MQLVEFSIPLIEEDREKPIPIEGQSFPYRAIANPRRFEELLYSIYKLKIERNELIQYDSVSLMSGVAEQGRDVVLFKNGKSHGIIQCKKYDTNLGKAELGKEITKLALYSLLDDRIIPDRNNFTYYIAVAKDFVSTCRELIDDFNNRILSENDLDSWMLENLEMPTLESLRFKDYHSEVRDILSKIVVKKIVPQEMDLELIDKPELQKLFFAVRTVSDNTSVDEIKKILKGDLSEDEVLKQLYNGSISLISEKNTFEGISDSHIQRKETQQLLKWLKGEPSKDKKGKIQNVCLLVAPAGYGKTVILKDFHSVCLAEKIPILGLKSDKLYSYTITDLQKGIGLSIPVFDFIEKCKTIYPLTVIVIDQIDALSQSMASDRRFLDVFKGFIDRFENDVNVRIIISVRNQDLNYDSRLRQYREKNTIQVSKLLVEQVLEQLKKLSIEKDALSTKLLDLLRIPNNLNIFSRIATNENSLKVTSIEELYSELWNQKILNIPKHGKTDKIKVRSALYAIADKMFASQRITASIHQFEDFSDEINYLESEQLLKREDKQVQFFHQSFYDFVFAKHFVESGRDLMAYIKDAEQSIHIRSAVKMILAYIRDYDLIGYDDFTKRLIADEEIHFHIKHLVFSNILTQLVPLPTEKNLVRSSVECSFYFSALLFEYAAGEEWFQFAMEIGLLSLLNEARQNEFIGKEEIIKDTDKVARKNLCIFYLRRNIEFNSKVAWDYFSKLEDVKVIQNILWFVNDWNNSIAYKMLAKCPDFEKTDTWSYYHVLNNIAKVNTDFALNKVKKYLPQNYKALQAQRDYDEREVLKSLAQNVPEKLFSILFQNLKKDFGRHGNYYDEGLIKNWNYSNISLMDDEHHTSRDFLYQLLAVCLRRVAKNSPMIFLDFFNDHKTSRYYATLRLLLFALKENQKMYFTQIFELFCHFKKLDLLTSGNDLELEMRELVETGFEFLDLDQKSFIINAIKAYKSKEYFVNKLASDVRGKPFLFVGLAKYYWLLRLPKDIVNNDESLRRSLMELRRRFPEHKDVGKSRNVMAGSTYSPVPQMAYQFMSKNQWLTAFRKYNKERDNFNSRDFLKGGVTELSSAFQNVVKENATTDKLEIINAIIDSADINIEYAVNAIWGWTESKANREALVLPFVKLLSRKDELKYQTTLTSIAGKLAGEDKISKAIVDFLAKKSLQFKLSAETETESINSEEKETSINGLVTKAINTDYGSAAYYLPFIRERKYCEIVFQAIDKIMETGPSESRAAVLCHFAYLTTVDNDRTTNLFIKYLNAETDIYVVASSIQSLQYFRSKGLKIIDKPLRLLIESNLLGNDDAQYLFTILYGSFLHNQEGAKDLLDLLVKSKKIRRSVAIGDIIKYYYTVEGNKEKNNCLLNDILSGANEEDIDDINWNFYDAGHIELSDIFDFVKNFIISRHFKLTGYFIEYLCIQCGKFVKHSVELFELAVSSNKLTVSQKNSYQIEDKAMNFVVSAYKAITENDAESISIRKKLLISFDALLKDFRFRGNQKILNDLI